MTDDADPHLLMDGACVEPSRRLDGCFVFKLPERPGELRMVSRAGTPAELGLSRDYRRLGIAVRQIRVWRGAWMRVLDASDGSLCEGFHGFEADTGIRWTDGDAALPLALFDGLDGACELEILTRGTTRYSLLHETPLNSAGRRL